MTYEAYKKQMAHFNSTPMSEEQFNIMQGINEQEELPIFIARKSSSAKEIKPTLDAHINLPKIKR